MTFRVVIPARYASVRVPGKPLRCVAGVPLVERTWRNAVESRASQVVVATDDERIAREVQRFGGEVRLTSAEHPSGTDRLAEVARTLSWQEDEIVVNLQCDEPFIGPELIDEVAAALAARPDVGISTLATRIHRSEDLFDPHVVKVVLSSDGTARYFSRAPIPWVRDVFRVGEVPKELPSDVSFLRHLGLYAYRVRVLRDLLQSPPSGSERAERLEQLRALDLGIDIHVSLLDDAPAGGLDTEEDFVRAEALLR